MNTLEALDKAAEELGIPAKNIELASKMTKATGADAICEIPVGLERDKIDRFKQAISSMLAWKATDPVGCEKWLAEGRIAKSAKTTDI